MQNQILNFIEKYSDKVVTDVARRMVLRFVVPVNELYSIDFINNSEVVSNSFIYDSLDPFDGNVGEFINLFGSDGYKQVSNEVLVNVTIKKDKIEFGRIDNFYFFLNHTNFFSAIPDVKVNNSSKKIIVLLVGEKLEFESKFIHMFSFDQFSKDLTTTINDDIDEEELFEFEVLNSIFKNKKLNSYLDYPITWISISDRTQSVPLCKHAVLETFFSIVSNTVVSKTNFIIRGYKTVHLDISSKKEVSEEVCNIIGELMKFIIDKQRNHDKLLLLRNTCTLFMDSDEDIIGLEKKIFEIKKNVEYNFNAYIQDKIKIFLDQKNKLLQEFIATTKKIEDLTNNLISQMRTISLSLLGSIFLSLLNDLNKGKTHALINLVLLSYTFFFLFNLIIVIKQSKQKKALENSLRKYTKSLGVIDNSDDSLSYENLKEDYLKDSLDFFDSYRRWMIVGLVLLIGGFMIIYLSYRFEICSAPIEIIKFIIGY
ncbi:hypothetical protein FJO98_15590 [Enterococcus sp. PF-2]|uniref:hypothetical protein n=1 Tax=unclassified Enterococcus TaxID=2608891 RepID=UPI00111DBCBC|nr:MULTISPECIES: hypothetical protein [unclassified Enterococcus]TPE00256.1 hypothetical protein FJP08_16025 [Enterococcus sp. PF-3]TPE23592.1 hypothetical protein FJO98_15590 [Enterococcus sp. PF-2]